MVSRRQLYGLILLAALMPAPGWGHGGVAFEDDQCVIRIDFLTAHFTVYQPETQASEEFCEDLPETGRTLFVMEYLHDFLRQMPVDFRIIRDTEGFGQFASWEHVSSIADLDAVTVFYEPATIYPGGAMNLSHDFDSKGTYIGIVTARHPEDDAQYNAVFYFQVGGPDYGSLPLFLGLVLLLQLGYWYSNGGWAKLKHRREQNKAINPQDGNAEQ